VLPTQNPLRVSRRIKRRKKRSWLNKRNFRARREFAKRSPRNISLSPLYEGSRDPVLAHTRSGGVLVLASDIGFAS
jgi:hypothetical protein